MSDSEPPTTPQELEAAFYTLGWAIMVNTFSHTNELGRIARGRAALASANRLTILRHLQELRFDFSLPARGLRALMCAQIGDSQDAIQIEFDDADIVTPMDRMGASWYYAGQCIALAQQERWQPAMEALGIAKHYARILNLQRRIDALEGEGLRIANLAGFPDPEGVQALREKPGLPERTRDWLGSVYICALWGRGRYSTALASTEAGSDYAYLASALLGRLELCRPDTSPASDYTAAADSWMQLWRHERVLLRSGLTGSTTGMYARLACGFSLAASPAGAAQALEVVGVAPPHRPDQRAMWAAISIAAYARGATPLYDPLDLCGLLTKALHALDGAQHVLHIIQEFTPEVVAIAALGPNPHPDVSYAARILPLLAGTYINVDAERLQVGEQGLKLALAGAYCEETDPAPTRTANLGVVSYALVRFEQEAEDQEHVILGRHWRQAREGLREYMDPQLLRVLGNPMLRCDYQRGDRTLEA